MSKIDRRLFFDTLTRVLNKPFRMRFIEKGKYGLPECWIYPLESVKRQKQRIIAGRVYNIVDVHEKPIMESKPGLLITLETLSNQKYLKEYLQSCF